MLSSATLSTTNFLSNDLFHLNFSPQLQSTNIIIKFDTKDLNTKNIPKTLEFLKLYLPNIAGAKCYNPENLPFMQEAAQTEIGHLFEHILLEYLSDESISIYKNRLLFSGVTTWNWKKEEKGVFRINITVGEKDKEIFINALEKSAILLKKILVSNSN